MSAGRVLSTIAASAAVAGCAVAVIGMAAAARPPKVTADDRSPVAATRSTASTIEAPTEAAPVVAVPPSSAPSDPAAGPVSSSPAASHVRVAAPAVTHSASAVAAPSSKAAPPPATHHATAAQPVARPVTHHVVHHHPAVHHPAAAAPKPAITHSAPRGSSLPLHFNTYSSTRVLTVRAYSHSSTTAVFQAWSKAPGGGWVRHGDNFTAHVGAAGIGTASESTSKTPAGAFTLTQAFGHYSDPGTPLPYLHTNSSDWWISQPGSLYNTHQHCSSGCGFTHGSPNEHLYYETPYYNYAVVIDYNTRNAPGGVHAGRGSAFFLHVTDGRPTAGCVSIPQDKLVSIMRWLAPSTHPRILIGVT